MMIKIADFANNRGINPGTVHKWISRTAEVRQDVGKHGRDKVIDTASKGYALLDAKYPKAVTVPTDLQDIEVLQSQIRELEAEVDRLKHRGLMDRIRNR